MGDELRVKEERRYWPVELRVAGGESSEPVIEGYAAVFDQLSEDLGGFREKVARGAFSRSIAENDVRALWEHNPQYVLGRNMAETLELAEDDHGLRVRIRPPEAGWARDLMGSMKRGDVNQMSFGFVTRTDTWFQGEGGDVVRTLVDVDLFDVSVVTYPAYPQTSVEARRRSDELRVTSDEQPGPADGDDGEEARSRSRARRAASLNNKKRLIEVS